MKTGDMIDSRYRLIKPMQTAWLAAEQTTGQQVLIRRADDFADLAVAEWLGRIWHAGLPRLLETLQNTDGENCLIFEYLDGKPLSLLAAETGKLPLERLLPLISQAARILAFMHQEGELPVLHLDVKPDHILVDEQGRAKLIDFGASMILRTKPADEVDNHKMQIALTPDYAAPEVSAGKPCPGSDLFSLGLTLLQLATGQSPENCRNRPLPESMTKLPVGLQRVIGRCLQSDQSVRYANADELACDLDAVDLEEMPEPEVIHQSPVKSEPDISPVSHIMAPLICIWDGAEFGCEMATVLAERGRVLVIDADLLNPRADGLLGIKTNRLQVAGNTELSGLDRALTEAQRGHLDLGRLAKMVTPTRIDGVGALTSQAGLDHYEYFDLDSLEQVLRFSRLVCDQVVVLCSRFVFDAFTCLCLQTATQVLIPVAGNSGSLRQCRRDIEYLTSRQQLERSKILFAAFDYNPQTDLSRGTLDALCDGRLAGCISERIKRRTMKNGALPYVASLDRANIQEYQKLICKIRLPEIDRKEVV